MPGDRVGRLPLSALLSQVLVAFTIECDNEFERQMPHRTSNYGSTAGRPRYRTTRSCCAAAGSPTAAR
jgi:hypothetical protein